MIVENTIKDPITGKVRGALYTNPFDCLWKTFKAEGIAGWYKGDSSSSSSSFFLFLFPTLRENVTDMVLIAGTTAHFLRITPHTIFTLVFNEVRFFSHSNIL